MYAVHPGRDLLYDLRIFYCVCCCCLICSDKSRDAQLYASEIADYHDKNVAQAVGVYLAEDRPAGRSGRLAVIVGAELVSQIAKPVCIYMMPRVVVLLLECCDDFLYFFFGFNGICMGNEPASIVLEEAPRLGGYALI